MANMPEIRIQLDEASLKSQVHRSLEDEFEQFAWRLRAAADVLDNGGWNKEHGDWMDEERKKEYKRGYEEGKAARDE